MKNNTNYQPKETVVLIYYSFDVPQIITLPTRENAVEYIEEHFAEELRIQTEENEKIIDEDITLLGSREQEYRRIRFKNGDIIEWSIPERITN